MNRNRIFSILGTVAVGGIAVVAGIAIGDAVSDDATLPTAVAPEVAPPAIGATGLTVTDGDGAPVPVEVGGEPLDLGPDGTPPPRSGGLVPVAGEPDDLSPETEAVLALADDAVAQAEAVAAGEAEAEPFTPPADASEVPDDSPAGHTPTPDELAGDGDDLPSFVDLCAGPTPGAPPPDEYGCPEGGVSGTVIALTSDPASELGIDIAFVQIATGSEAYARDDGPEQVAWGYCDFSSVADGNIPVWVLATRPFDVAVEHGAPGSPAGTVEASTPDARLDTIAAFIEADGPEVDPGFVRAQACVEVPAPDGPELELTVTATDSAGGEITETVTVPVGGAFVDYREPEPTPEPAPPPPPEPPVREAEIHPFDERVARIVVPHDDPARERVHVATVTVDGPDALGETCSSIQQSVFDGSRRDPRLYNWEVMARVEIPSFDPLEALSDLFGVGDPEEEPDPNEGLEYQTVTMMVGDEGAVYDVCVWWTGNPRGSTFATPPIVEQRRYRVSAPDHYLVEVVLEELQLWRSVEADQFTSRVLGRTVSFPPTDMGSSVVAGGAEADALDAPITLGSAVSGDTPPVSELHLTNEADDSSWAVMLGTRTNACDGTDEGICIAGVSTTHLVELPMGEARATRCLGGGCPDGPGRDGQAGWARVRVVVTDHDGGAVPSRASRSWQLGEAGDFTGDPVVLPETPRVDPGLTDLLSGSGAFSQPSNTIRGTIAFDRPVTGEIQVQAVLGRDAEGCSRDPIVIGPEPRQTIAVNLTGLCRDTIYAFPASVVDAAGNRAEIFGRVPLVGDTRALNVRWGFDVEITAVHTGESVTLEGGGLLFDDKAEHAGDDRCLFEGYHVTTPPHSVAHPIEDSLIGPTFTVGATLELREGCRDAGGTAHTERWEAEMSTDLLEALFFTAGRTQTSVVEVTGPVVDYTVRIRMEHIQAPTCRGGYCPGVI